MLPDSKPYYAPLKSLLREVGNWDIHYTTDRTVVGAVCSGIFFKKKQFCKMVWIIAALTRAIRCWIPSIRWIFFWLLYKFINGMSVSLSKRRWIETESDSFLIMFLEDFNSNTYCFGGWKYSIILLWSKVNQSFLKWCKSGEQDWSWYVFLKVIWWLTQNFLQIFWNILCNCMYCEI